MDEPTAKVVEALASLASAAVWPALATWALLCFRKPLLELLPKIRAVKLGELEIELEAMQAKIQQANLVIGGLAMQSNDSQIKQAAENLPKPDVERVKQWAREHRADNPWDMGPMNWEKCLYDLKYPGGIDHKLVHEQDGRLKWR